MHLLSNKQRFASRNFERLLGRMRARFPKYAVFLEVAPERAVEIFNDVQLEFASRAVALFHSTETETERMEREAAERMAAESSDDDEQFVDAQEDMTEDWFETLGFKHEHL